MNKLMDKSLAEFLQYKLNTSGAATCEHFTRILNMLSDYSNKPLAELSEEDISDWLNSCSISTVSFRNYKYALKDYYNFIGRKVNLKKIKYKHIMDYNTCGSIDEILQDFDDNISNMIEQDIIVDASRYDTLKIVIILSWFSLSNEEMASLKRNDFKGNKLVLRSRNSEIDFSDYPKIAKILSEYNLSTGYYSRPTSKRFVQYIPTDTFLKKASNDVTDNEITKNFISLRKTMLKNTFDIDVKDVFFTGCISRMKTRGRALKQDLVTDIAESNYNLKVSANMLNDFMARIK